MGGSNIFYDKENKTIHIEQCYDTERFPPKNKGWILIKTNLPEDFVDFLFSFQNITDWDLNYDEAKYLVDFAFQDFIKNKQAD